MKELIDLHCHIVPYVDDGAEDFDESLELLRKFSEQGIKIACATPHLRANMFEMPDGEIKKRFLELKAKVKEQEIPVHLLLSREYHCDKGFFKLLEERRFICMGQGKTVLCEFSHVSDASFIMSTIRKVRDAGYVPLVAHVERYAAVHDNEKLLHRMKEAGAFIQVNAGSVTGDEGFTQKRFCKKLIKSRMIDVIASDTHDIVHRPPHLKECAEIIEKQADEIYVRKITLETPFRLLKENM